MKRVEEMFEGVMGGGAPEQLSADLCGEGDLSHTHTHTHPNSCCGNNDSSSLNKAGCCQGVVVAFTP